MTSTAKRKSKTKKASAIPQWIFDIHDEDDSTGDASILQELEIDVPTIIRCIMYTLLCPLRNCCRMELLASHPLNLKDEVQSTANNDNPQSSGVVNSKSYSHDFWGPWSVVTAYGLVLWLGSGRNVSWVYVVWCGSAVFLHIICRVWCSASTFSLHFAVIGYSIVPMLCPVSILILLLRPARWVSFCLEAVAVTFSSFAALRSYHQICHFTPSEAARASLLIVPVVVTHLYFMSLLPIDSL